MLHRNGTPPPSATIGKRAAPAPPRTEFPPELPADSPRALIFNLARQKAAGLPLLRWIYWLLLAAALACLLLPTIGAGVAIVCLLGLAGLWLWHLVERRRSYVHFTPAAAPVVLPAALPPSAKLPVYVSGLLAVDVKVRQFAGLPGFYRTFATREHALIGQVRRRRFAGMGAWPEEEEGLWYAFFSAGQVHSVRTGEIAFGRRSLPGFVVEYTPAQPLGGRRRRKPQRLTIYAAFPEQADYAAALADLAVEPLAIQQEAKSDQ